MRALAPPLGAAAVQLAVSLFLVLVQHWGPVAGEIRLLDALKAEVSQLSMTYWCSHPALVT